MLYIFGKIVFTIPMWLIWRPKIRNYRYLWRRGRAIVVCNHNSLCDPVWLGMVMPRVMHFMAKRELFATKLSRLFMKLLFTFPVDRDHADRASLKQAMDVLEKGRIFGIFPEGRRSVTGEIDELEKGAAFLALRTGAPIIPVYADPGMYRRFRYRLIVGEPMDAAAIAAEHKGRAVEIVTSAIQNRLAALKTEMEGAF